MFVASRLRLQLHLNEIFRSLTLACQFYRACLGKILTSQTKSNSCIQQMIEYFTVFITVLVWGITYEMAVLSRSLYTLKT